MRFLLICTNTLTFVKYRFSRNAKFIFVYKYKLMKIIFLPILLFLSLKGFSQDRPKADTAVNLSYSAKDSVVTDETNQTLRLYGKVDFAIDKLHLKADQVYFDKKNKTVTATGLINYSSPYKTEKSSDIKKAMLKYKSGSNTVFIN